MANKVFGEKLKALRQRNNLTQKDVYEQLGISQSTFSSWEIGKSEPDAMTFLELCRIYMVDDILLEFTGHTIRNSDITSNMIMKLDAEDKAEIRGEIKQMLKSPKYEDGAKKDNDLFGFDIAADITNTALSATDKNKTNV